MEGTFLKQLIKYVILGIVGYIFIFAGTYFLTDFLKIHANISYFVIISIDHVILYLLSAKYVFLKRRNARSIRNFIIYVASIWFLNNLFFNILYLTTNLHYIVIIILSIFIFGPLRFLSLRYKVF